MIAGQLPAISSCRKTDGAPPIACPPCQQATDHSFRPSRDHPSPHGLRDGPPNRRCLPAAAALGRRIGPTFCKSIILSRFEPNHELEGHRRKEMAGAQCKLSSGTYSAEATRSAKLRSPPRPGLYGEPCRAARTGGLPNSDGGIETVRSRPQRSHVVGAATLMRTPRADCRDRASKP